MLECERLKFEKAEMLKQRVKKMCGLSFLHVGINTLNDNINIELNQKEATQEVLSTLKNELSNIFNCTYRILPTPILSSSYTVNPVKAPKVLYNFKIV